MFCWLLTIFLLGLAFGLSDGGRLAKLVTFLTAEAAGVVAEGGGRAVPEQGGVDVDGVAPAAAAAATTDDEAAEEAAAAAAAAATLFRLKWTISSSISVARI